MRKIVIALPKGSRLLEPSYEIFKNIGYRSKELEGEYLTKQPKQLEFESDNEKLIFLLVKIADIPQYVDKNWADLGVAAFDCYREYELASVTNHHSLRGDNFTSDILPDLGLCSESRFCVAGKPEVRGFYEKCKSSDEKILEVATQYPNIAARYFSQKGIVADIITVSGSSELMPKQAEVDVIFDIVETGQALVKNGLEIFDEAMPIQTRVLVSKAAIKYDENISKLVQELRNATK